MNLVTESTESCPLPTAVPDALASLSDADLLDAWGRDRHADALAALVDRYSVMVLSVCRRRCRSDADADDAFQSTFLYLARNSTKIRHPERLPGWLHRVAQRAAVATLKHTKRETQPMVEHPADPDDPLDRLTQRHEAIVLDEELADLPEHYRSAIVMHLYDGFPIQSLAEHFGTTVGSIRGRLQRGKQLLAQRVRRRGVVPVLAIAAAGAWTASTSQAAQAGEKFVDATCDGNLPDPPIDTSLLESLLAQGIRLMPSLYTAAGLLGGSTLIALMTTGGPSTSKTTELSFSSSTAPVVAQFGAANLNSSSGESISEESNAGEAGTQAVADSGKFQWAERVAMPEPESEVAIKVFNSLDGVFDLDISTTLDDLPSILSEVAEIPVLIDDRGVAFSKIESGTTSIEFAQQAVPLRTALRRILRPLGLRAVVEDEGLVITADPAALVHQGIGSSHWINIDQDAEAKIAVALDLETTVEFIEAPLQDVIEAIGEQHDLKILLDRRALEEIGLSGEETVTLRIGEIKLRNALSYMLRELDLTYVVIGESLVVTTIEASEENPATRIYWLEGTGFAVGGRDNTRDYQSIIDLIQSSIVPDTWEALGGPSTMASVKSSRPALMISTTYAVHEDIDKLFQTLRETHFGKDPVLERVQIPAQADGGDLGGGGFF